MSLVDAQGWPLPNTHFPTTQDLLLICTLASTRAGFSNLSLSTTALAGNIRCNVSSPVSVGSKKRVKCNLVLVEFKMAGSEGVRVSEVHKERLKASAHGEAHKDLSEPLSLNSPSFAVKEGMKIAGNLSVHLLEGCLLSLARKENHYLKRNLSNSSKDSCITISFVCAKGAGADKCKFAVRIASTGKEEDGEEVEYVVLKVIPKHTCRADAGPPNKKLQKILDGWPKITLGPQPGAPKPKPKSKSPPPANAESASEDEANNPEKDLQIDPAALQDEENEVEVDQLEEEEESAATSQAHQDDIFIHSSSDPAVAEPERKKAKLTPPSEGEDEEQKKRREKKAAKKARKEKAAEA
ncbi:hypothetical protein BCR35DRAFT_336115 [Leucosporidium creatinivorum]|uniref:Uncharacterized protein n=1 Tax=Leucosporidium creatinivorum TaxID=106004 RepID=A0A1Y2CPA1_9BASI|nr:hypothetical protein BCR35DRAFT_336115 [Leucosporidium creatinivorum]